jgi:hypothetical protein
MVCGICGGCALPDKDRAGPYLHERLGIIVCVECKWTYRARVADVLEWAADLRALTPMGRQQHRQGLLNELVVVTPEWTMMVYGWGINFAKAQR